MNLRQTYALAHPLDSADGPADILTRHRRIARLGDLFLMTILAVDR